MRSAYVTHLEETLQEVEHARDVATQAAAKTSQELAELRESSVYLLGTRLSFAAGGNAYRYQCSGGYEPEDWGVWLSEEPLAIVLPLVRAQASTGEVMLKLETLPFLADCRRVSSTKVWVNEDLILHVDETRPGVQRYDVPLRLGRISPMENLVVEIAGCAATSPASIGINNDCRRLSLGLVAVSVVANGNHS